MFIKKEERKSKDSKLTNIFKAWFSYISYKFIKYKCTWSKIGLLPALYIKCTVIYVNTTCQFTFIIWTNTYKNYSKIIFTFSMWEDIVIVFKAKRFTGRRGPTNFPLLLVWVEVFIIETILLNCGSDKKLFFIKIVMASPRLSWRFYFAVILLVVRIFNQLLFLNLNLN